LRALEVEPGPLAIEVARRRLHAHSHLDLVRGDIDDVRDQAGALVQFDDGDVVGQVVREGGVVALVHRDERVDRAGAAGLLPAEVRLAALVAERLGGVLETPAAGAVLQVQLTRAQPVPEGCIEGGWFGKERDLVRVRDRFRHRALLTSSGPWWRGWS